MMWISCSDALPGPENGVNVIGWISPYGDKIRGFAELVHFDGSDWYDQGSRTCTVTHWMELPGMPE